MFVMQQKFPVIKLFKLIVLYNEFFYYVYLYNEI